MRLESTNRLPPLTSPATSITGDYYENVAGLELADEFYAELQSYFQKAADSPESYSIRERDLRRVNLKRFPYHFLFRVVEDRVRVLVVRHHKKRPSVGTHRR